MTKVQMWCKDWWRHVNNKKDPPELMCLDGTPVTHTSIGLSEECSMGIGDTDLEGCCGGSTQMSALLWG